MAISVSNRSIFYAAQHPSRTDHASIMLRIQRLQLRPRKTAPLYRIALDNKISSSDTSRQAVNHASVNIRWLPPTAPKAVTSRALAVSQSAARWAGVNRELNDPTSEYLFDCCTVYYGYAS